ncbi:MAG: acyl-[acyl-carrier-protein]--UDP-N-acetylglucosamine O-acyltransferase [Alphaproteobacteria bacterium CG11_big_fil_rev_8_21_14_0_20_44_7]|nr:MAG: acyl-[acyl-carrier-protein]--UDP-N-acetylglucosamine O-acyltransferase [Alphaproteobacteria bacterium CG11_big_fil_rev_8_21_14_0_20_44_7]
MSLIHPTAIIEDGAKIAPSVKIGAYCCIGKDVVLHDNVELKSHVAVDGITEIGEGTVIFPFAAIGHINQDMKYAGEPSRLVIGKNNKIREHVTMHPGTTVGGMLTKVGDNCLFMVASHVAHDCMVGNNVIMANNATLAGHVTVGDFAIIGGLSAVHQFVRIGQYAMVGGMSGIESDLIPYGMAYGERASLNGLNLVGLRRKGFSKDEINAVRKAFKEIFDKELAVDSADKRLAEVKSNLGEFSVVKDLLEFIESEHSRSLCRPKG